jgi:uncharacterized membrane protein YphA (DoxX/SURF4 family)
MGRKKSPAHETGYRPQPEKPAPIRWSAWPWIRVCVGAIFVVSGFEKLISPYQNFQYVIEQYQMVSGEQAAWIAQALPWAELIGGSFFLLGLWTTEAAVSVMAMFGIFITAVGQALIRQLPLGECGCFGELISIPLPVVLAMDTVLLLAVAAGLIRKPGLRAMSLDERL